VIRIAGPWHIDTNRQHTGNALLEIRYVYRGRCLLLRRKVLRNRQGFVDLII
jgi:hypothetical protein